MAEEQTSRYKANVHARWRNRVTGASVDVRAGTVVEFEDGDFNDPETGEVTMALTSLEDVLARGLFSEWDESQAGDPDHMSRDEMLELMRSIGADKDAEGNELPHNVSEDELRTLVKHTIATRNAGAAPSEKRAGRGGR